VGVIGIGNLDLFLGLERLPREFGFALIRKLLDQDGFVRLRILFFRTKFCQKFRRNNLYLF
jgi:hypothetical protein